MAVTGSGTKTDPYIVHNYTELRGIAVFKNMQDQAYTYVNLANDIDCNDYGDSFEWETVNLSDYNNSTGVNRSIRFDLCGHTIKNILVKAGNHLFAQRCQSYKPQLTCMVCNGKILNVFNNGIQHLVVDNNTSNSVLFENISMSINGNGITSYTFYDIRFNKCSIYFSRNSYYSKSIFISHGSVLVIQNSDIYLDCGFLEKGIMECPAGNGDIRVANSRLRGKCTFDAQYAPSLFSSAISNSVMDIELTNTSGIYAWYLASDGSTGVVNSSKIHTEPTYYTPGMIRVTDAELKSAAALQAKGFNVVKVGG